ncbi:MAG TPA: Os1348 family NHLP clan protein [Candidatus Eisenbacteria bacterium]
MSQRNVERAIGHLATDEATRREFANDPHAAISELIGRGMELTECERESLASIDPRELTRFAMAIDARLQRSDLRGGTT